MRRLGLMPSMRRIFSHSFGLASCKNTHTRSIEILRALRVDLCGGFGTHHGDEGTAIGGVL